MLAQLFLSAVMLPILSGEAPAQTQPEPRFIRERTFQLKDLQRADITIAAKHKLNVWVMDTEAKRQEGMMFMRESDFTEKQGMIFVFLAAEPLRFWMMNTYVPLDIAYLNADGSINSIYRMEAFDTTTDFSSKKPSKYALEVKAGLFKKLGISVGDKVEIPSSVKAKN